MPVPNSVAVSSIQGSSESSGLEISGFQGVRVSRCSVYSLLGLTVAGFQGLRVMRFYGRKSFC